MTTTRETEIIEQYREIVGDEIADTALEAMRQEIPGPSYARGRRHKDALEALGACSTEEEYRVLCERWTAGSPHYGTDWAGR